MVDERKVVSLRKFRDFMIDKRNELLLKEATAPTEVNFLREFSLKKYGQMSYDNFNRLYIISDDIERTMMDEYLTQNSLIKKY
jgi:hypothetical protein